MQLSCTRNVKKTRFFVHPGYHPSGLHQAGRNGWGDGRPPVPLVESPVAQAMEMEAEAERRRRAEVLQSEGDRQSEVNLAQGLQGG